MARKIRCSIPDRFYHIMLRGNDGQRIFYDDQDYYRMSFFLQEGVERFGHRIHGFCFMSNHIHLLIQLGSEPLSKIIQNFAFRYSRYINWRHDRIGHLFQGRFKSILLDEEEYFTKLLRYIHLNPVEANIVKTPSEYGWSSHRTYLGLDHIPWITTDHGLMKFGSGTLIARTNYLQYMQEQDTIEMQKIFKKDVLDGEFAFHDALEESIVIQNKQKKKLPLTQVLQVVCDVFKVNIIQLTSDSQERGTSLARAVFAMLSKEFCSASIKEMGEILNRDESSISSLIKRLKNRCQTEEILQEKIQAIRNELNSLQDALRSD